MSIFIPLWFLYGMLVGLLIGCIVVWATEAWRQSKLGALVAVVSFAAIWPLVTALFILATLMAVFKRGSRRSP